MSRVECRTRQVDVCGTKSTLGNVPVPIQKVRNKSISRLHADRDACKESTDTSRKATQGCSATLNPVMVPKPAPMATGEDRQRQKQSARGTSYPSDRRGCQLIEIPKSSESLLMLISEGDLSMGDSNFLFFLGFQISNLNPFLLCLSKIYCLKIVLRIFHIIDAEYITCLKC